MNKFKKIYAVVFLSLSFAAHADSDTCFRFSYSPDIYENIRLCARAALYEKAITLVSYRLNDSNVSGFKMKSRIKGFRFIKKNQRVDENYISMTDIRMLRFR